jgi:hypothetical protein
MATTFLPKKDAVRKSLNADPNRMLLAKTIELEFIKEVRKEFTGSEIQYLNTMYPTN